MTYSSLPYLQGKVTMRHLKLARRLKRLECDNPGPDEDVHELRRQLRRIDEMIEQMDAARPGSR